MLRMRGNFEKRLAWGWFAAALAAALGGWSPELAAAGLPLRNDAGLASAPVPVLGADVPGSAGQGSASGSVRELLERGGGKRVEGRLAAGPGQTLRFLPIQEPMEEGGDLAPGATVLVQGDPAEAMSVSPAFQFLVGRTARISGMLRSIDHAAAILEVPWQELEVRISRPGIQAVVQRPGEALVFVEDFERLDAERWSISEGAEVLAEEGPAGRARFLRLPSGGSLVSRRLAEPLLSGRVELVFRDDGQVVEGQRWTFGLTFRGPSGPATVRILLGWAEESLAVESPEGPALAVQRLARVPGWHRLTVRFAPEQTTIAVDGKELAHGRGPAGPLEALAISTSNPPPRQGEDAQVGKPAEKPAGVVGEVRVIRFAEPPASLEIDPTQDEARLVAGDQLYGTIQEADSEWVVIDVDGRPLRLSWSEVAGLYFRREAVSGAPLFGTRIHVEWAAGGGDAARDLDFAEGAVVELSDAELTLATPYCGTLRLPRNRIRRLRLLEPGWFLVVDPAAHHLGDNISTTPPLLDPPVPEGDRLERSFGLTAVPQRPVFLVLDVVQVVGETAGTPYSNLVQKGELRTYVVINGNRIDHLNRYVTTTNEAPERIRIPIPAASLRPGRNVVRLEQTGIANDPTWLDDLGILLIGVEVAADPQGAVAPNPFAATTP